MATTAEQEKQLLREGKLIHLAAPIWKYLFITDRFRDACRREAEEAGEVATIMLYSVVVEAIRRTKILYGIHHRVQRVEVEHTEIGTVVVTPNSKGGMTIDTMEV